MSTTVKSKVSKIEDVVKKSNQTQNLNEGDWVTLVLNNGYYKDGGKLLKNDRISEKHHLGTFYSGKEYYFLKRDGDRVLIQLCSNGMLWDTFIWVDISEVYNPFDEEFLNSQPNDYVEYEVKVPITLKYSFNDWKNRKDRRKELIKFKTPKDGKEYDKITDIPKESRKRLEWWNNEGDDGYKIEEVNTPTTIFEQLQWNEFKRNFDMVHNGEKPPMDFFDSVKEVFTNRLWKYINDMDDEIISSKDYGYGKTEYIKGE